MILSTSHRVPILRNPLFYLALLIVWPFVAVARLIFPRPLGAAGYERRESSGLPIGFLVATIVFLAFVAFNVWLWLPA